MSSHAYAIATMDTKGDELAFVAERLRSAGVTVKTVDVGTGGDHRHAADVVRQRVAQCHPDGADAVLRHTDRGEAVAAMSVALREFMTEGAAAERVAGVIGLGGSGGTALITPAMQALPVGLPKVMVSTVAAGNVAAYVGASDIVMFPSIVDVAGLNAVSKRILSNAAHALAGMIQHSPPLSTTDRPAIGMTMFGVTTPCVDAVRKALEARGFDVLVFHATGTGGRTMEKLVEAGMIRGVLDITTTEVADEVLGGVFPAGPKRFEAILNAGIPYVMSVGALDMVNFGAKESVPASFRERKLHVHNSQVTLMRTTPEENRRFAHWIVEKLIQAKSPVALLIPNQGVSAIDAPGQPFHDPEADAVLFDELERGLASSKNVTVDRRNLHINDAAFAEALVDSFLVQWSAVKAG